MSIWTKWTTYAQKSFVSNRNNFSEALVIIGAKVFLIEGFPSQRHRAKHRSRHSAKMSKRRLVKTSRTIQIASHAQARHLDATAFDVRRCFSLGDIEFDEQCRQVYPSRLHKKSRLRRGCSHWPLKTSRIFLLRMNRGKILKILVILLLSYHQQILCCNTALALIYRVC